jgi:hypothetical protein
MLLITDYHDLGSLHDFLQTNVLDHESSVSRGDIIFESFEMFAQHYLNLKGRMISLVKKRQKKIPTRLHHIFCDRSLVETLHFFGLFTGITMKYFYLH